MALDLNKYSDTEYILLFCADCQYHTVRKEKIVGFCKCDKHKGWLTDNLAKSHHCEEKKCVFLRKMKNHEFWKQTELLEEKRKERKNLIKEIKEKKSAANFNRERRLQRMKNFAQNIVNLYNYPIILTRIAFIDEKNRKVVLNYISDQNYNDYKRYNEILIQLDKQYKCHFLLKKVKRPDGQYATREDWQKHEKP